MSLPPLAEVYKANFLKALTEGNIDFAFAPDTNNRIHATFLGEGSGEYALKGALIFMGMDEAQLPVIEDNYVRFPTESMLTLKAVLRTEHSIDMDVSYFVQEPEVAPAIPQSVPEIEPVKTAAMVPPPGIPASAPSSVATAPSPATKLVSAPATRTPLPKSAATSASKTRPPVRVLQPRAAIQPPGTPSSRPADPKRR